MKRGAVFLVLWAFVLCVGIYYVQRSAIPRSPSSLWPIPSFEMVGVTAEGVRTFGRDDLLGRPWLAGFIYTRCAGPCPLISARMSELQKSLPDQLRLVSFSVDPDHDSEAVLQKYATHYKADPRRWVFVRGEKQQLYKLVYEGFRMALVEDASAPAGFRVTHSTRLALVDAKGVLRQLYDANSEALSSRIRMDLEALQKEPV